MKFGFILTKDKKLVEVTRINKPRFELVLRLTGIEPIYLQEIKIIFNKQEIKQEIKKLIEMRENQPLDIPDYNESFFGDDLFEIRNYSGKEFKLCKTGFDNQIIFLLNILDTVEKDNCELHFFFAKNHKELREFQDKHS